jgi:hypothetical protein
VTDFHNIGSGAFDTIRAPRSREAVVMRPIALLSCVCLCSIYAAATASEPVKQTIEPLEFMTGCWHGEGWMRQGPELKKFQSAELVEIKAGKTVLAITGKHVDPVTGKVVHDAFAIVSRAREGEGYRFASFLGTGQSGEYSAKLQDGAFVWELVIPNRGTIRYTIRVAEDTWQETGHYSPDGTQWHETFGMTLKRAKPGGECFR